MSSSEECYLDRKYYPHMFVLPALIIMITLSCLKKRLNYNLTLFNGRPGLAVAVDFLDVDHDRVGNIAIFGAGAGVILSLVILETNLKDPWSSAFISIGVSVEIAVLYYPLFACLTTKYKILGALIGFSYCLMWFVVSTVNDFDKCRFQNASAGYMVVEYFFHVPTYACYLFLLGKYINVIIVKVKQKSTPSELRLMEEDAKPLNNWVFAKPWFYNYVKNVLKASPEPEPQSFRWLRKIYNPHPYYRFSTQSLSIYTVCFILIYMFSFSLFGRFLLLSDIVTDNDLLKKLFLGFRISVIISAVITGLFTFFSILHSMECHKNNMLRMFKGDKSFLPKLYTSPQSMIGCSLNYSCYQFGYLIWGYFIVLFLVAIIVFLCFSLSFQAIREDAGAGFKYALAFGVVALLTWIILPILALTVFRDRSFPKTVMALNNRNVYMVFTYFWFFVGLPMGLFSALSRILKSLIIGSMMLCRLDRSMLPSGYEVLDTGHASYIYYLHVQAMFRNPILRVFCQSVFDAKRNTRVELPCSKIARNKWLLLFTLQNNPKLQMYRKSHLLVTQQATALTAIDVVVPESTYGSTNQAFPDKIVDDRL